MRYMGSKAKIAKYIIPELIKDRKENQYFIEPFVGGANLICNIGGLRIGNDKCQYIIALLKSIQSGWIPPDSICKNTYESIKQNKDNYPPELVGFVGYGCSFGGKFFNGYIGTYGKRSYAGEASRSLTKQAKKIQNIEFIYGDYRELKIPDNSIIYCDPPYEETTEYRYKIDYDLFWEWCRSKSVDGHRVFISS